MHSIKLAAVLALSFALSACNDYTTEICREGARNDIANLVGDYRLIFAADDPARPETQFRLGVYQVTFKRQGVGRYTVVVRTGNQATQPMLISTCVMGNDMIAETYNGDARKSFTAAFIDRSPKGLQIATTSFDRAEIEANKLPYSIVDKPTSQYEALVGPLRLADEQKTKVMVVNNGVLKNPAAIGQLLHGLYEIARFYPF